MIKKENNDKFPKLIIQGNKYASSKSKIINKIPTIKNWILNIIWPSENGSKPHS